MDNRSPTEAEALEQRLSASYGQLPRWRQLALDLKLRWLRTARWNQITPEGEDWDVWLALAGRGFGKTRLGAEDLGFFGLWHPGSRLAAIGATQPDCRKIQFEGKSGLLNILPAEAIVDWKSSMLELHLLGGSIVFGYGAREYDRLRGPEHHRAWADEIASWPKMQETWDMLQMGLRLGKEIGETPRTIVTSTPKPKPLIKELVEDAETMARRPDAPVETRVHMTRGSTFENAANLPTKWLARLKRRYEGTRLGDQELHAKVLSGSETAIIKSDWWRIWEAESIPRLDEVIVSVDTASSEKEAAIVDDEGTRKADSACTVWGVFGSDQVPAVDLDGRTLHDRPGPGLSRVILLHGWKGWFEFNDLLEKIIASARRYKATKVVVEAKSNGVAVIQELRRRCAGEKFSVEGRYPKVDKVSRAYSVSGLWRDGIVYAPPRRWADMVIEDCEQFPTTGRDITDSATQAMEIIRRTGYTLYDDELIAHTEAEIRAARREADGATTHY